MLGMALSDISIASLNFASLSSPSSLANSCTFLASVWRIIRNLAQSALATVPGWRRRVLFLVQLKNRRIFSLCSVCLRCNAYESDGIFFVQGEWRNLELSQSSKASGCGRWSSQGALYRGRNLRELSTYTQFKEGMSSKITLAQFPREPSTSKSVPLHKGAIEYTFYIPKRSALSLKRKHWWRCTSYAETSKACYG